MILIGFRPTYSAFNQLRADISQLQTHWALENHLLNPPPLKFHLCIDFNLLIIPTALSNFHDTTMQAAMLAKYL